MEQFTNAALNESVYVKRNFMSASVSLAKASLLLPTVLSNTSLFFSCSLKILPSTMSENRDFSAETQYSSKKSKSCLSDLDNASHRPYT
jgi:hypothetical protein